MKLIESPLFWILMVLVVILGVACTRRAAQHANPDSQDATANPQKEPGFREFVKDPQLWNDLVEEREDVDRKLEEAAKKFSDSEVADAVRWFVLEVKSSRDAWGNLRALRLLGTKTYPELLRLLGDPALRERLAKPTGENLLPEAPFNRICLLLDDPPPEAALLIAPFMGDQSAEIRKDAAAKLGKIGTDETIIPIKKALSDSDEYIRSYAMSGLSTAAEEGRLSDNWRRELFEIIQRMVTSGTNSDSSPQLLFKLDSKRAIVFFLSDPFLNPQSKAMHDVMELLNEQHVVIPRARLLAIIDQIEKTDLNYPHTYQLRETIRALGSHQNKEDLKLLEKFVSHPEKEVAAGAAVGLLSVHGLSDFDKRIWTIVKERGEGALTAQQRHYQAVLMFDAEVNNGGLSQYFFNSGGNEWRTALAGLEAMGSKERLAVLKEAVAKFGPDGPSENRDRRMNQQAKLAKKDDDVFKQLDNRYYNSTEVVDVLIMRYVLKNPEAFR